jgi:hypothetical protein
MSKTGNTNDCYSPPSLQTPRTMPRSCPYPMCCMMFHSSHRKLQCQCYQGQCCCLKACKHRCRNSSPKPARLPCRSHKPSTSLEESVMGSTMDILGQHSTKFGSTKCQLSRGGNTLCNKWNPRQSSTLHSSLEKLCLPDACQTAGAMETWSCTRMQGRWSRWDRLQAPRYRWLLTFCKDIGSQMQHCPDI